MKIAQQFIAGTKVAGRPKSPVGTTDGDSAMRKAQPSLTGLCISPALLVPAMNRWAIFIMSLRDRRFEDGHCDSRQDVGKDKGLRPGPQSDAASRLSFVF